MTNQETFDRVATHLLTQMKKSSNNGKCVYRDDDYNKCAIGCLIDNKDYSADMDNGYNISHLLLEEKFAVRPSIIALKALDIDLLDYLQYVHDHYAPSKWKSQLETVALTVGNINTNILKRFS